MEEKFTSATALRGNKTLRSANLPEQHHWTAEESSEPSQSPSPLGDGLNADLDPGLIHESRSNLSISLDKQPKLNLPPDRDTECWLLSLSVHVSWDA